jgi:hypothetical protein
MNQMVNQLMLGQPLYGSTGAPNYDPLWMPVHTWIFAARAFPYEFSSGNTSLTGGTHR